MKLDDVIPYIQNIDDIDTAKMLLELEVDPDGYYYRIYKQVNKLLKHNINQKELKKIFDEYDEHIAIKYYQHFNELYERMKEDKKHLLIRKKSFLKSILDISDIYSLRLYLTRLKERVKEQDISYNSYVPIIKLK